MYIAIDYLFKCEIIYFMWFYWIVNVSGKGMYWWFDAKWKMFEVLNFYLWFSLVRFMFVQMNYN